MQVEFCDETFGSESVQRKNLAVGRSGRWHLRTPSRTCSQLPTFACAASPPCPQQWGANLTIPACPCAQEASSPSLLSIPFGRPRRWLLLVRPAACCAWLGPRMPASLPFACPPQDRALLPERHETIQGSSATFSSRSFSSCPSLCFCFWFAASFSLVLCSCRLVSCQ